MFTLWKCNHCELSNYHTTNRCQACFKKQIDPSPLQSIIHQEYIGFHGFLRFKIFDCPTKLDQIPLDIINLCFKFYETLNKILPVNATKMDVFQAMTICKENKEYMMCYRLLSLLRLVEIDDSITSRLIAFEGKILLEWKQYDAAEIRYQTAIEIAFKSNVSQQHQAAFHALYGQLLFEQYRWDSALIEFIVSSLKSPMDPSYAYCVASCYRQLGNHQETRIWFAKCIELDDKLNDNDLRKLNKDDLKKDAETYLCSHVNH